MLIVRMAIVEKEVAEVIVISLPSVGVVGLPACF